MDAQILRGLIGLEIGLKPANLARVVYSTPGEKITDEIGQAIRTQRRTESGKALRAAVILAAGDDGKVSLLEILNKYPLAEVYVDVASISGTVGKLQSLAGTLQSLLQDVMRSTTRTTETTGTESPIEPRPGLGRQLRLQRAPGSNPHLCQRQHRSLRRSEGCGKEIINVSGGFSLLLWHSADNVETKPAPALPLSQPRRGLGLLSITHH